MFKTYWNGKILSPYAKEIKLENDQLKLRAISVEKLYNDKKEKLAIIEEHNSLDLKKDEINSQISNNENLIKELSNERDLIEHQNKVNKELIDQLKYLESEKDYSDQQQILFKKQKAEFEAEKIKLVHFKRKLMMDSNKLQKEREAFEKEKKELLDFELNIESSSDMQEIKHPKNITVNIDA